MWSNPLPQPGSWVSKSGGPDGTPKKTYLRRPFTNKQGTIITLEVASWGWFSNLLNSVHTPLARNRILLMCEKLQCQRMNMLCPISNFHPKSTPKYLSPSSKDCLNRKGWYTISNPRHILTIWQCCTDVQQGGKLWSHRILLVPENLERWHWKRKTRETFSGENPGNQANFIWSGSKEFTRTNILLIYCL